MNRSSFVCAVSSTAVLSFFLFGSVGSSAIASIPWRDNVDVAMKEATRSGKPLLIEVSTDWCHYCVKMERETFTNVGIIDHVSECFVPLRLDGDTDKTLVKKLGVRSYPTMVIVSPKLDHLATIRGFRTVDQLSDDLASICARKNVSKASSHVAANGPILSVFGTYCPVTSLGAEELVLGREQFPFRYRGFDLFFASQEARERFQMEPTRYWPMGDGYCAVSVFEQGQASMGSLSYGLVFADRVWLFASRAHLERFVARPAYFTKKVTEFRKSMEVAQPVVHAGR